MFRIKKLTFEPKRAIIGIFHRVSHLRARNTMGNPLKPIKELMVACRTDRTGIIVWEPAISGAAYFGLLGKMELVDCVGREELREIAPKRPRALESWQSDRPAPLVDACTFRLGSKFGYIAYFFYNNCWQIKSFKKDGRRQIKISKQRVGQLAKAITK